MEITQQDKNWALVAHLAGPFGNVVSMGLLGFVVPVVIWLVQRDERPFVGDQAKEATNFQISIFLLKASLVIFAILTFGLGLLVVIPGLVLLFVIEIIMGIAAGVRASNGVYYRYPFTLRLLP